jgi:catalase-peroxidase
MQYQANPNSKFMMLPSDMSLLTDRLYTAYAKMFANDQSYLTDAFARAWYKLTTRDMGPIQRCLNVSINGVYQLPPAQPFQYNLPPPPTSQPDWAAVKMAIRSSLYTDPNLISGFAPDLVGGRAYWGAMFIHIAFQCAATYRSTDHLGGANGARCLLLPQDDWIFNAGTDAVVSVILSPLKSRFPTLTFSDLIVLAGTVALEDAANITLPFCPGRSDADPTNVYPKGVLVPGFNYSDVSLPLDWMARVRGLLPEELVAIYGRSRSYNQMQRMDYLPMTWQTGPIDVLGNEYFVALVSDTWISIGDSQYRNTAGTRGMTASDMQILFHPKFKNIAQNFAADEQLFKSYLASAWTKMMNSDRYDGPLGSVCQ